MKWIGITKNWQVYSKPINNKFYILCTKYGIKSWEWITIIGVIITIISGSLGIYIFLKPQVEMPISSQGLEFSGDIISEPNGRYSLFFEPEKLKREFKVINLSEDHLEVWLKNFPMNGFFSSSLKDKRITLAPGENELVTMYLYVKEPFYKKEYSFQITDNLQHVFSFDIQILEDLQEWGKYYQLLATSFEEELKKQSNLDKDVNKTAEKVAIKTFPDIKPDSQQIVAVQILSSTGHDKEALIAYQKAKEINSKISANTSFRNIVEPVWINKLSTSGKAGYIGNINGKTFDFILNRNGQRMDIELFTFLYPKDEIKIIRPKNSITLRLFDDTNVILTYEDTKNMDYLVKNIHFATYNRRNVKDNFIHNIINVINHRMNSLVNNKFLLKNISGK